MVAQAEEVANGGEDGVGMVVVRFGHGRADGGAGVVEELILEPHRHVGYGLAVGFAQVGVGGEEGGQLALAELIGVVAKLLQQGAGGLLMAHQAQQAAVSRSMIRRAGSTSFCRRKRF